MILRPLRPLLAIGVLSACQFSPSGVSNETLDAGTSDSTDASDDGGNANARRRLITIAGTFLGTLANVPIPVRTSGDADFTANAAEDGSDLFFQLQDGTRLPHDLEFLDAANGDVVVWVVLPTLPPEGISFDFFYGAGNAAPATANAWENSADLVYHFEDRSLLVDHSPTAADAIQDFGIVESVPAVIGSGVRFDGASSYRLLDDSVLDRGLQSWTLEMWVNQESSFGASDSPFSNGGIGADGYFLALGDGLWSVFLNDGSILRADFGDESDFAGSFVHLAVVVDRTTNDVRTYANGILADQRNLNVFDLDSTGNEAIIGSDVLPINATVDELRAFPFAQSSDWIASSAAISLNPDVVSISAPEAATFPTP